MHSLIWHFLELFCNTTAASSIKLAAHMALNGFQAGHTDV